MKQPGETAQVKVVAKFKDGAVREVTKEATVESNTPDLARVDATSGVKGERTGEATLLVRYQGKLSTVPVTVLNPKQGFVWKPLPQHNFIDQHIDGKLQNALRPLRPRTTRRSSVGYHWTSQARFRLQRTCAPSSPIRHRRE